MTETALDPAVADFLMRNADVARRLANMAEPDRDAAFKRIRRWIDDQQSKSNPLKEFLA